jgi:hypothetical protein
MEIIKLVATAFSAAWLIAALLALFHGFKSSIIKGILILLFGPITTTYYYFTLKENGPLKRWCGTTSILFLIGFVLFFIYYIVTGK